MRFVLVAGVALNWAGAAQLVRAYSSEPCESARVSSDYAQMKLFTAGTAAVFGALYLYLFIKPTYVMPFLIFGASLKTWAFLMSMALYLGGRLGARPLLEFGCANLVVAIAFWTYIVIRA